MKILHILDHSLPLHSGYTFRSQSIFRSQIQKGWKPVVLTSPKHEASWRKPCPTVETIEDVHYYRCGRSRLNFLPVASEGWLMAQLTRRLSQVAESEKPDVLHAHSPILNGIPAVRVGRRLGIPVVYEIRAFWEDAAVDHGTHSEDSWRYHMVQALETWTCCRVDQVTVLCEGIRQDLERRGIPADKLTIIYNGIDPESFRQVEPDSEYGRAWSTDGKRVVGFIGSFYRYEGLDLLLKAFARLVRQRPDLVLLLVGGGEMELELRQLASSLGIEGSVVLTGRIPHQRIGGVYSLMDVLVYPRYSMRLTELVTPLKPLEAMAMGRALVASDIGGHRELIQDGKTGLLFRAGAVEALQEVLERILDSSELRACLGHRGREWVRSEHSWEKTTFPYSRVYERALEKRRL